MFSLTGKVAWITGGNGGIGLGYARALAKAGADIAIWGRSLEKNESTISELSSYGIKAKAWSVDVSDEDAVSKAFSETLEEFGRVDSCFANAGANARGSAFTRMKTEDWKQILDVNLTGVFYCLRLAADHMVTRAKEGDVGGRLVATSSTSALMGAPRMEHYASTKGAILSLMQALAVELAPHGITANSIVPGWIETQMTEKMIRNKRFGEAVLPRIPVGRWGTEDDFGGIAVYLASALSQYHTGDAIKIDGGYTLF